MSNTETEAGLAKQSLKTVVGASFGVAVTMIGQQVASKAIRDAFFLSVFPTEYLARVMTLSSLLSVGTVFGLSYLYKRFAPKHLVPIFFLFSALLFAAEWILISANKAGAAALVMYLHTASFGAISISGFWAVMNERFDPHTAKRVIGRVANGATIGGLIGGVFVWQVADVVSIPAFILILLSLNVACALAIFWIGRGSPLYRPKTPDEGIEAATQSPFKLLTESPYLRHVTLVVVVIAFGTAAIDYVFKAKAAAAYVDEDSLVAFFSLFYLGVGIASFLIQSLVAKRLLNRWGIATAVATLPVMLFVFGGLALVVPTLLSLALMRGGAASLEGSTYRSGYELLYTPLSPDTKRPAKTLIDVGGDKLGSALGAFTAVFLIGLLNEHANTILIVLAIGCGALGVAATSRLAKGYTQNLATRLGVGPLITNLRARRDSEVSLPLSDALPSHVGSSLLDRSQSPLGDIQNADVEGPPSIQWERKSSEAIVRALLYGDEAELSQTLKANNPLPRPLAKLLVARFERGDQDEVVRVYLSRLAPQITGAILDAVFDETLSLQRRLMLLDFFCHAPNERGHAALMSCLTLESVEIRQRASQALALVTQLNPRLEIHRKVVLRIVSEELGKLRRLYYSPHHELSEQSPTQRRIGLHVSVCVELLSIAYERQPFLLAIRALLSDDKNERGTAKEYLETTLPNSIAVELLSILESRAVARFAAAPTLFKTRPEDGDLRGPSLKTLRRRFENRQKI